MRALVTGATGFVGGYLVERCARRARRVGLRRPARFASAILRARPSRRASLRAALEARRPTSSFISPRRRSFPTRSSPMGTYETNARRHRATRAGGARLRRSGRRTPRIVFTSSAEVYGPRDAGEYPLHERLASPGQSVRGQQSRGRSDPAWPRRGASVSTSCRAGVQSHRPGPKRALRGRLLAAQLAAIAAGGPPLLLVGNLEAERDFLDVRDVVAPTSRWLADGERGEIYNVCSGRAVAIRDVLRELITIASVPVEVRDDPERMRPSDLPLFVGNADEAPRRDRLGAASCRSRLAARHLRGAAANARRSLEPMASRTTTICKRSSSRIADCCSRFRRCACRVR